MNEIVNIYEDEEIMLHNDTKWGTASISFSEDEAINGMPKDYGIFTPKGEAFISDGIEWKHCAQIALSNISNINTEKTSTTFKDKWNLANENFASENYDQSLVYFQEILGGGSLFGERRVLVLYYMGIIYSKQGKIEEAKEKFTAASKGMPGASVKKTLDVYRNDAQEALLDLTKLEEREQAKQDVMAMFAHKFEEAKEKSKAALGYRNAAQEALLDLTRLEEQAKQELEDVMAMFAHKFRGPLQSIEYLATDERIRENVLMMNGMLNIFSTISTNADRLRQKLLQDRQGEGSLYTTLEQALALSLAGVLTLNNRDKIRQHYLNYAKITGQVPTTTTRQQWKSNYFDLEKQLQTDWQNSFMAMTNPPKLDNIASWLKARFFPLEIHGFAEADIHFEHYGVTESILLIIIPEIFLNALKYYASDTQQPVQLRWECEAQTCQFSCANPTSEKEQLSSKGSGRGHQFLSILAKKIGGHFPRPPFIDNYVVKFSIPTELLMEKHP